MALPQGPYDSASEESAILKSWLEQKAYKPEYDPKTKSILSLEEMKNDSRVTWTLICPPPNAYGRPHIGNISGYAYQDAMARYARMQGKKVLMIPGKDHAGLEGEGVFVREVLEKNSRNKFDMTREEFYKEIWEFNMKNKELALKDEQEIGLSADFDRDIFTLDPRVVNIVLETFVGMHKENMIYKGIRLVNWDPKARSVIADNQCVREERDGKLYYIKYLLNPSDISYAKNFSTPVKIVFSDADIHKAYDMATQTRILIDEYVHNLATQGFNYINKRLIPSEIIKAVEERPMAMAEMQDYKFDDVGKIKVSPVVTISDNDGIQAFFINQYDIKSDDSVDIEFLIELDRFISEGKSNRGKVAFINSDIEGIYNTYKKFLFVATTRPETMFGDTAVAVNPEDERFTDLVGKKVVIPLTNIEIPIITSPRVLKDFGTGALKITPAHAQDDFVIMTEWNAAKKKEGNDSEMISYRNVIGKDLKLVGTVPDKFKGRKYKEALPEIIEDLKSANLLEKEESVKQNVLIADRTRALVEPIISSQWFIDIDKVRQPVIDMVKNGEVNIHPENMKDKFYHWMENLRDWAISRSLWWGYRMPVWYAGETREIVDEQGIVREEIKVSGQDWQTLDYSNPNHILVQIESPGAGWIQDENVLDTWFSSGQWPYATLMAHGLMDKFYPTDVMETGFDILENWVSRMMMFSYFRLKQIPFKDVFLHGLVNGPDGQKMSKSKGNVVDIDKVRAEYGTDAVRLVYFYQNTAGANYAITYDKLKNFKQFCNKIWNASKFVLQNYDKFPGGEIKNQVVQNDFSKKVLAKIAEVKEQVTRNIDNFQFGLATFNLYQEFWHVFCDEYIEESKKFFDQTGEFKEEIAKEVASVMMLALKEFLKMLHPFIPFITQRVWNEVPKFDQDHEVLMYSKW